MSQANAGYAGYAGLHDDGSHFNRLRFNVREMLSRVRTAIMVEVIACTSDGALAPAGRVSVQPMVNQVDGNGNSVPHGIINGLLYFRLQGGANAIIMDPVPGDKGLAVFCDRDISVVKATGARGNPGSWRMFDMADGFYMDGGLNGAPVNYLQFAPSGVNLVSSGTLELSAGGTLVIQSGVTIILDGIAWDTHTHEVSAIGSPTGPPL